MIRPMEIITIEGCVRGVIYLSMEVQIGWIGFLSWIALSVKIPLVVDGKYISRNIHQGDWCILVCQTCLCTGDIHPAGVKTLDDGITSITLSLKMYLCGPHGADYDGDKMTLYSVYSRELVRECESVKLGYESRESQHLSYSSDVKYVTNEE